MNDTTYLYNVGKQMEWSEVKDFAQNLGVENLQYTYKNKDSTHKSTNWANELKKLKKLNKLNKHNRVAHCAFLSEPREHWYGIQLKMNPKGYIVAKIADSLKTSYSESSHEKIEHDELLKAIKAHNEAVCEKRKNSESVVKRRKAYKLAVDKSRFKYNGKAYRQRKPDDAVQIVPCHTQIIKNSCGLHTVLNLYLMNKDPNITNTSQFGEKLEEKIKTLKGPSNQEICINALANVMQIAIAELQNAKQPEKQVQQRCSLNNEVKTAPARQM